MSLWQDFVTNEKKPIHKWAHYFPIYERHFAPWKGRSTLFLEIGVQGGGSLQMWQRYLGPLSRVVGFDIDPACAVHESAGVFVRIGDQSDTKALQALIDEFGVPDIVLDDGSHKMSDIQASFDFLYPKMNKNAIYMVEDLHTAFWEEYGGGVDKPGSFIEFAKGCVNRIHANHSRGVIEPDQMTADTFSISFYDSIVCFEKGDVWWKDAPQTGTGMPGVQKA